MGQNFPWFWVYFGIFTAVFAFSKSFFAIRLRQVWPPAGTYMIYNLFAGQKKNTHKGYAKIFVFSV